MYENGYTRTGVRERYEMYEDATRTLRELICGTKKMSDPPSVYRYEELGSRALSIPLSDRLSTKANGAADVYWLQPSLTNASISGTSSLSLTPLHQVLICGTKKTSKSRRSGRRCLARMAGKMLREFCQPPAGDLPPWCSRAPGSLHWQFDNSESWSAPLS